jgi:hypothetical protein
MTTLAVELTFPSAPISSLLKRINKGIEEFYYAKLFLTNDAYGGAKIWRGWLDLGFHVAIFSPPPGVSAADRVRIRTKAPSRTPVLSAEASNADALKDLQSLLQQVDEIRPSLGGKSPDARVSALEDSDIGRQLVGPVVENLKRHNFEASEIDGFRAMFQRGFDALTNDEIQSMTLMLS